MLSTYCQHCGSKNEYSSVKPKFCSSCGQMLAGDFNEARAVTQTVTRKAPVARSENYDEEGTDVYEVPNISRLEYDIEVSNSSTFTLGSIMPQDSIQSSESAQKKKRGRPRKNG